MLVFACIAPHPPIILPNVGSPADREKVKKTISALEKLGAQLAKTKPDCLLISSPHPDWGIEVPLHFLISKTKNQKPKIQFKIQNYQMAENLFENWDLKIENYSVLPILTSLETPRWHFLLGQKIASILPKKKRCVWIASGDMSHRLAEDGPYGLHSSGPKFDQKFIELLKKKGVQGILNLPERLVEEAGECGLRSFCMLFGALKEAKIDWQPEILSYEAPFGVGYLVANLKLSKAI